MNIRRNEESFEDEGDANLFSKVLRGKVAMFAFLPLFSVYITSHATRAMFIASK